MRSFYKVCIKLAIGIIGLGIILTIIGVTTGGTVNSFRIGPFHMGNRINYNEKEYNNSGNDFTKEYTGVESIDIDIHYGEVEIKQGDKFEITANNIEDNYLDSYMDGNTWKIEDEGKFNFSIFGIQIGNRGIGFDSYKSEITIYIPKDFKANKVSVNLGAGAINIDQIVGDEVSIDVGAGQLYVNQLYAYEKADFSVGAGEIEISNIEANQTDIECGMGSVTMNGVLTGDSSIDCGVGEVTLNLKGKEEDYNYYVDSGVGNVIINEDKYSFTSSTKKVNDNAKGDFDIECGVGNVTILVN